MRYNRYGDDFLIDKIQPDDLSKELLSVGELYAILHVVFAETEIMVHIHKKYYLSIA